MKDLVKYNQSGRFIRVCLILSLILTGNTLNALAQEKDSKAEVKQSVPTAANVTTNATQPEKPTVPPETTKKTEAPITTVAKLDDKAINKDAGKPLIPKNVKVTASQTADDTVTLKNGDRLTGRIVRSDGQSLLIRTNFAGDVNVVWDAVEAISTSNKLYLTLSDGQTIAGKVTTENGQIRVETEKAGVVTTTRPAITIVRSEDEQALANATAARLRERRLWQAWDGNFDLGLTLTAGNSETFNFAMAANAVRDTERDKITFYYAQIYARDNTNDISNTTANAIRTGVRYDYKFSRRWSAFGFADVEQNELQGLDLRFVFGGGGNYRAIDTERKKLDLFAGLSINREFFDDPVLEPGEPFPVDFDDDRTSLELLFGDEFNWQLSDRFSLKQRAVIFPSVTDLGEFRFNFDTTLSADLTRRLAWQFTFSNRFLSDPPPGFGKNDTLLSTGIRFKFGK